MQFNNLKFDTMYTMFKVHKHAEQMRDAIMICFETHNMIINYNKYVIVY